MASTSVDGGRLPWSSAADLLEQDLARVVLQLVPERAGLDDQPDHDRIGVGVAEDATGAMAAAAGVPGLELVDQRDTAAPSREPQRLPHLAPAPTTTAS